MKTLCWILVVFFILGGCAPKQTFEVERYEKTKDWVSFDQNLTKDGVYQRTYNKNVYFVFYGTETKYDNIIFEIKENILNIRFDSVTSTSGAYEIYEIKTNISYENIKLYENGKETNLSGVFSE